MRYSQSSSPFDSIRDYLRQSQMPATITLIVICTVLFLVSFFDNRLALSFLFVTPFQTSDLLTIFFYPLMNPNFLYVVFGCLALSWCGGSLERSWGSIKFVIFFFSLSVVTAVGLLLGSLLLHQPTAIVGMWIPLTSLIVAWAAINPMLTIMVYGLVPVQARWIALFEVGVIYFILYAGSPIMGLFALLGPLTAFIAVRLGLMTGAGVRVPRGPDLRIVAGGSRRGKPLDDAGITMSLNPIDRFRAWQQRRRLAKLLQNSGYRDDDRR